MIITKRLILSLGLTVALLSGTIAMAVPAVAAGCQKSCLSAAAVTNSVISKGVISSAIEVDTTSIPSLSYDFGGFGIGAATFGAMVIDSTEFEGAAFNFLFGGNMLDLGSSGVQVFMQQITASGNFSLSAHFEMSSASLFGQPTAFEWVS